MGDVSKIHVLQIIGEPVGGIRKHVHALLLGLSETEVKQSYAYSCVNTDAGFKKELPKLEKKLENRLLPLKIKKKPSVMDFVNIYSLIEYVKTNKITLVHGHGAKGGAYARLLKKFCTVKVIYTPHGGSVHKMFNPIEEFLYSSIEKYLSKYTDFFVFESKYTAESYFEKIWQIEKSMWTINYSGINLPNMEKVVGDSKKLNYNKNILKIGVFGVLRTQKGQVYAIEALKKLIEKGVDVELHLFGDGPDRKKLNDKSKAFKIEQKVFFHGMVNNVYAHMYHMDIILIPSIFESFGYVALESFSLKKPVVVSKVGGLQEIVSNGIDGLFFESKSAKDLAEKIFYIINNPRLFSNIAKNGYDKLRTTFAEEGMIKEIEKVYRDL